MPTCKKSPKPIQWLVRINQEYYNVAPIIKYVRNDTAVNKKVYKSTKIQTVQK